VQNAQSTQSSIEDTNYAAATSQLSRAQVLSQAAQAMVAQANQLPQQVLKLLQ
jgi:flagellin